MRRASLVAFWGAVLGTSLALAQNGVVVTKMGQKYEGEVTEDAMQVTIVAKGIRTRVSREDLALVKYVGTPDEEIQKAWKGLGENDVRGRLALAQKAFTAGRYVLARSIASEVMDIDANSREGTDLLAAIRQQMLLEMRAEAARKRKPAAVDPEEVPLATMPTVGEAIPRVYLDQQDINLVRQNELRAGDEGVVRIQFLNNVRRRFAQQPNKDAEAFASASSFQQAIDIIEQGEPSMRKDVIIMDDPIAIRDFRGFERQLLMGCATANCHGTTLGGNFFLYTSLESQRATVTNFYLLTKYSRLSEGGKKGIFGGAGTRLSMIDRQHPEHALLLQYGLPRQWADVPHPNVFGFRPMFKGTNDLLYRRIHTWMGETLRTVDPVYDDITYVSPLEALIHPATQPATAPAPVPAAPTAAAPAAMAQETQSAK
jgi:hypothetical protein